MPKPFTTIVPPSFKAASETYQYAPGALMQLGPIEAPAPRTAAKLPRQCPQFGHVPLSVITARETFQVLAHQLIEALPHRVGLLAGTSDEPRVHGQGDIHIPRNTCTRVPCLLGRRIQLENET
jgi:hypothetical protein